MRVTFRSLCLKIIILCTIIFGFAKQKIMSGRTNKPQTVLTGLLVNSNAKRVKWRQQQVAKEQQQALKPEPELNRVVAPRRSYRPHILRPSTIRRICHLPAEQCNSTTEAKVRYFNSKFGKCSLTVCHEDICPYTEVCKKHKKKKPKPSISMMKSIRRIVKRSARNSVIPKGKLNSRIAKKATKSP